MTKTNTGNMLMFRVTQIEQALHLHQVALGPQLVPTRVPLLSVLCNFLHS